MENWTGHFKDCKPEDTVSKIKDILFKLNIETEEIKPYASIINTNSLRVVFKGTNSGTNGKGINETFCQASAYAEFMERFQNNYLNFYPYEIIDKNSFKEYPDEVFLTASELVKQNNPFLDYYFSLRNGMDIGEIEKAKAFENVNIPQNQNKYLSLPYYDVRSNDVVYLPSKLTSLTYGSNGMVAGNSFSEAMVQGLCEVLERVVQKELILKPQSLPTIPDEVISRYDYIYKRYKKAQSLKGYKVIMKDCSLGGVYPVAGLLIIQENTGRFGLKLGSHPNLGVCMERTLTEATQGGDIDKYAERSFVDFTNKSSLNKNNLMNSFATGLAQYPHEILIEPENKKFVECNYDGNTNESFMRQMLSSLIRDGHDVLIRDNSWLGFPSYHIIIPGLSEVNDISDNYIRLHNTMGYIIELFKHPEKITVEDCKYIQATINSFKGNLLLDNIKHLFPYTTDNLPYGTGAFATRYLAVLCDVLKGDYKGACEKITIPDKSNMFNDFSENDRIRYSVEKIYLSAMSELKSHEDVMKYLSVLLDKEALKMISELYSHPQKILGKVYSEPATITKNNESKILSEVTYKARNKMSKTKISQFDISTLLN